MRIKRLEIQGFKSFKDKTVIHFDHCITGIVGPNGCGKSNIVDAFFWVMGEQSYKHMRGSSSEDLIFNGSSKYSALGVAEATLVMETPLIDPSTAPAGASARDEASYTSTKEISVTRRLYRSGEGEYFINGTLARLKDIQELFMDTGVGAKGYSVIEQGQIGKIVNAKPEERRLLIEEAAGIAKYKARKKESLRKIEATQGNLSRLTDIIQEIEKSLVSLEKQAHKASIYKKYREELFQKETRWGKKKKRSLENKLGELSSRKEHFEQDIAGLKAELQESENLVATDQIYSLTQTKQIEELQEKIQDLGHSLSEQRNALELSKRRQGDLNRQLESLESEEAETQEALTQEKDRLSELKAQLETEENQTVSLTDSLNTKNQEVFELRKSVEELRRKRDQSQKSLYDKVQTHSSLSSKVNTLASRLEMFEERSEKLSDQRQSELEQIGELEKELVQMKEERHEVLEKQQSLREEKKEITAQTQEKEQTLRSLETNQTQLLKRATELKSKLQSLQELDESHEGLNDLSKAALDWAKAKNQSISAIADVLKIEPGFETAVEGYLESQLENLLIPSSNEALPLLEALRSKGRLRVHVALSKPLISQAHLRSEIEALLPFPVLGELSEKVQCEASLFGIFSRVLLVEASTDFFELVLQQDAETLRGWTLLTRDGSVAEFPWEGQAVFLRSGELKQAPGSVLIRRKQAIEALKPDVLQAQATYEAHQHTLTTHKNDLELNRAQIQSLQSELQQWEIKAAGAERDWHQTEKALKTLQNKLESIERELQTLQHQSEQAQEDREEAQAELQSLLILRSELESEASKSDQVLQSQELKLKDSNEILQSARIEEASLRERLQSLKKEIRALENSVFSREKRIQDIQSILKRTNEEQHSFTGNEAELYQRIEEYTQALGNLREELSSRKDEAEETQGRMHSALERMKEIHKALEKVTLEATEIALQQEKLSAEMNHLVINLEEKYGAGCLLGGAGNDQEENSESTDSEIEEITVEEVEKLKERIRRLGEVNLMAIEEFEQLKERSDHLINEKADLEKSLKNLNEAIEHINKTSEERFSKAFEAISSRFEKLFPIIFGGGMAKLSLVYPENSKDILEAGVDILAQPPGKKVANITLLSGGEKALTAVSLIFAIFMVKPSPFCVLDEVDAPLDDANIGKFNALLKEMSVKSQFILITHNKKTMELNDTLYGVTMEEPGVSKMVSIQMH